MSFTRALDQLLRSRMLQFIWKQRKKVRFD
ncbi:hypothetical protein [Pediococcus inopinatus]